MNTSGLSGLPRLLSRAAAAGLYVVVLGTGVSAAMAGQAGYVFTANELGNSISRIDLSAGKVETTPVPISPHNVQITQDGSLLLAVGEIGKRRVGKEC